MKNLFLSLFLISTMFLFSGCFNNDSNTLDRISSVTEEQTGEVTISLAKSQISSKAQYKIDAPYTMEIIITPEPTEAVPHPISKTLAPLSLSTLYDPATQKYIHTILNIPPGKVKIRVLIKDGEAHPLFTGLFLVDVIPGKLMILQANLDSSNIPTLVGKTLQDYFPLIHGRQLDYSCTESEDTYDKFYNLISSESPSNQTDIYNIEVAPAPSTLFNGTLPGDTAALVEDGGIGETHFKWINGSLHFCGEREEWTENSYIVSSGGSTTEFSNVDVKRALTLSANSIINIPMIPADFALGDKHIATVVGQMKYFAYDTEVLLVGFFHPVEIVTSVEFVGMVDIGSFKDVLHFIMTKKIFDTSSGKVLILENSSEVYFAAGIGKIKEKSYIYEYKYDTVTKVLFNIVHEKIDINYLP